MIFQKHHTWLRHEIRQKHTQLNSTFKQEVSAQIIQKLISHPVLQKSHIIASYLAADHEIDLQAWFTHAWQRKKLCYLPLALDTKKLAFGEYHNNTRLQQNRWKILEPLQNDQCLLPHQLEVVLVPLIAFDQNGYRLGRGLGYYDRSFSFLLSNPRPKNPYLIGVSYQFQAVKSIFSNPWDVPLNEVITETAHYHYS